jgi:hypothetical protein
VPSNLKLVYTKTIVHVLAPLTMPPRTSSASKDKTQGSGLRSEEYTGIERVSGYCPDMYLFAKAGGDQISLKDGI